MQCLIFAKNWPGRWVFAVAVTATVAATVATACIPLLSLLLSDGGVVVPLLSVVSSVSPEVSEEFASVSGFSTTCPVTTLSRAVPVQNIRIGTAGFTACKFSGFCTNRLFLNGRWHLEIFISFMNTFHNIFPNLHMETLAKTFHRFERSS